jgi:hypothetical protein
MKKFLVGTLMMMVFAVVLPLSVSGQNYCRKSYRSARYSNAYYGYNNARYRNRSYSRRNRRAYRQPAYYSTYQPAYYSYSRRPSYYRRHRNVINMAIGTAGGAVLGGLLGGRRGVAAGALLGAGGSALYTYKLRPKRRYYR